MLFKDILNSETLFIQIFLTLNAHFTGKLGKSVAEVGDNDMGH